MHGRIGWCGQGWCNVNTTQQCMYACHSNAMMHTGNWNLNWKSNNRRYKRGFGPSKNVQLKTTRFLLVKNVKQLEIILL